MTFHTRSCCDTCKKFFINQVILIIDMHILTACLRGWWVGKTSLKGRRWPGCRSLGERPGTRDYFRSPQPLMKGGTGQAGLNRSSPTMYVKHEPEALKCFRLTPHSCTHWVLRKRWGGPSSPDAATPPPLASRQGLARPP